MCVVSEQPAEGLKSDELIPVKINLLRSGEALSFPIYACLEQEHGETQFRLLVSHGQKLTDGIKHLVEVGPGTQVFTKAEFANLYNQEVESQIPKILSDETIPLTERSEILYTLGTKAMEEVFLEDVPREAFDKAVGFAENLTDFLNSNEGALYTLMKFTSNDYKMFAHSIQVCTLGLSLFYHTFYDEKPDLVSEVVVGLLFHDIGKTRIDKEILKNPGVPTPIEWEMVKRHPVWGIEILEANGICGSAIEDTVRSHHERMDGQGYPDGLKGLKVPALAQLAALTNTFASLTCNRPYKLGVSAYSALEKMMNENHGDMWVDSRLLEEFIIMLGQ